jgi:hypothetical protein
MIPAAIPVVYLSLPDSVGNQRSPCFPTIRDPLTNWVFARGR